MPKRLLSASLLLAYSATLVLVIVFKGLPHKPFPALPSGQARQVVMRWGANFVPFKTILPQLQGQPRWPSAIANLAGNTLLFMPIGFLFPLIHRKMTWPKSLAVGIAVSLIMEGLQWIFNTGVVDVDDVILNALGVTAGYGAFSFLQSQTDTPPLPS